MLNLPRIALVTGATQGLGLALAEGLARRLNTTDVVYLSGRDPERVQTAVDSIIDPAARVCGVVLDVTEARAIEELAAKLSDHHNGVDIVLSNAAARLTPDVRPADLVTNFVDTNNLATTRMLRSFGPILRPGGSLLIVASEFGTLSRLPARLRDQFDTSRMSLDDVDSTILGWRDDVVSGTATALGWPEWINIPSKIGQVAAVRILAREGRETSREAATLVAAVCPGLIDTEASRPWFADMTQAQSPAEAAAPILDLALDKTAHEYYYGELVQRGRVIAWD